MRSKRVRGDPAAAEVAAPRYVLYVFQLRASVASRKRTPTRKTSKPYVYVGYTSRSAEERLEEHRIGRFVADRKWVPHYKRPRPDLSAGSPSYATLDDALAGEAALAKSLEARGFTVVNGTGAPLAIRPKTADQLQRPRPVLGNRFTQAVAYAVELHALQARKATTMPYMTHLLAVCSLVLEDGGTEDEAIAALLHDGPEDQGGQVILDEIGRRFGAEVAAMVDGLSDTVEDPKPPWRERKAAYLVRLRGEPESVLRVSLADKLHNLRSVAIDLQVSGEVVWDRFRAKRPAQAWYYRELLAVFEDRLPTSRNLGEYRELVAGTFG